MSELQDMQSRIEQLEKDTQSRIAQLEQETLVVKAKSKAQTVRHRLVLTLAVAGIGLSILTQKGNTQAEPKVLVCSQLRVVDEAGETVLQLGATADFQGRINLYNTARKEALVLTASDTGDGRMWANDLDGKTMAQIGGKDGTGFVWTKKE